MRAPKGTKKFQPTLPARGATRPKQAPSRHAAISTHAPRTGSDKMPDDTSNGCCPFQPTLPARGATKQLLTLGQKALFQPTLPARGATAALRVLRVIRRISTHAPRTGSDGGGGKSRCDHRDFNPRSPHGERRGVSEHHRAPLNFNPRSPHGERRRRRKKQV